MTDSAAVSRSATPDSAALQWLALSLTPAMGPIRGHRLAQRFGDIERIFVASLTELEAAGLPAVSAQSIALGTSYSLAEEEFMKAPAMAAQKSSRFRTSVTLLASRKSTIHRSRYMSEAVLPCRRNQASGLSALAIPLLMASEWPSGFRMTWHRQDG